MHVKSQNLQLLITLHSMLISWLLNIIEPSLHSTLSYHDDAQSLWIHLKQLFMCCKQNSYLPIKDIFGRMQKTQEWRGVNFISFMGWTLHMLKKYMRYSQTSGIISSGRLFVDNWLYYVFICVFIFNLPLSLSFGYFRFYLIG